MAAESELTSRDAAVVQSLLGRAPSQANAAEINFDDDVSLPSMEDRIVRYLREQEKDVVTTLEKASNSHNAAIDPVTYRRAHNILTAIIEEHPQYASAYVNRAQVVRLMLQSKHIGVKDVDIDEDSEEGDHVNEYMWHNPFVDLTEAIYLLKKPGNDSTEPVSKFHAHILRQACTHLGLLYLEASDTSILDSDNVSFRLLPSELKNMSPAQLQDMANRDFTMGAYYGSTIAKSMAVKTNPYAKACGAIVKQTMEER